MARCFKSSIYLDDCTHLLAEAGSDFPYFDLTFLDPPFNQGKEYRVHNDCMTSEDYWDWMREVCRLTHARSSEGAAIYFMQREKNADNLLRVLRESGWHFQNLIVWRKLTSANPSNIRYGKAYQVIAFATKGPRARVFNRLRIDPPQPSGYKPRRNGIYLTDIWSDIRELTSGYFAGEEVIRTEDGKRAHKQQSPIALLLRIILSSTMPGDCVADPFAGTGTSLAVASQTARIGIGIEKDRFNVDLIKQRLSEHRKADSVEKFRNHYIHTAELGDLWPMGDASNVSHQGNSAITSTDHSGNLSSSPINERTDRKTNRYTQTQARLNLSL